MSFLSKRNLSLAILVVLVSLSISFPVIAENILNNDKENGSFVTGNLSG